jgi:hypothetical protein
MADPKIGGRPGKDLTFFRLTKNLTGVAGEMVISEIARMLIRHKFGRVRKHPAFRIPGTPVAL